MHRWRQIGHGGDPRGGILGTRLLTLQATRAACAVVVAALVATRAQPVPSTAGHEVLEAVDAVLALAALDEVGSSGVPGFVEAVAALLLHYIELLAMVRGGAGE